MSTPIDSIKNLSDMQLAEDENDENGVSAAKYNERHRQARARKEEVEQRACEEAERHQVEKQQRVEVERCRAKEQAKRHVSGLWLVMTELMAVGRGGHCTTARQGQGEGVGVAGLPTVSGLWAQV